MFYRASERSDGAGLGLYIAKEIVAKLKGTISIDSRPGEGTTVSVVIPNETENFHDGT
jgi:signal transduction histidine kinase